MVWSVIQNFRQGLKYRGGWRGLIEHMYTNGDYPFKFGTYMGCDAAGNRYYENRVDYPFGQHRWVEPGDINNFDSSSIPPEWHGWMTSMNDSPPSSEEDYISTKKGFIQQGCQSNAPLDHNVGHQEKFFNFHHMHNQSQVRSRGYNIGNPIVGLPPNAPDGYYTQPGSPYNPANIRETVMIGDLDADKGGGRPYKSEMWADRLRTPAEKAAIEAEQLAAYKLNLEEIQASRKAALKSRGAATFVGKTS
uniref:NADH dehydrogenase [ubiquinone] 1 alpha subcomplex subunit 12 n=1 Tax=Cyclophora tenuis TaxID=216820 RepID=A0A7S1CZ94_CYCTE|mmetsp:Transcript_15910/g.26939  ORF Transcript_15910/g.26939 Transcript_15910/m.26939 type:complete len:248 (+) Transcript_15910:43-786(+)